MNGVYFHVPVAQVVMRDLCEGFQVCLLGEAAPQVPCAGKDECQLPS